VKVKRARAELVASQEARVRQAVPEQQSEVAAQPRKERGAVALVQADQGRSRVRPDRVGELAKVVNVPVEETERPVASGSAGRARPGPRECERTILDASRASIGFECDLEARTQRLEGMARPRVEDPGEGARDTADGQHARTTRDRSPNSPCSELVGFKREPARLKQQEAVRQRGRLGPVTGQLAGIDDLAELEAI
jgi:hypothetical protein